MTPFWDALFGNVIAGSRGDTGKISKINGIAYRISSVGRALDF